MKYLTVAEVDQKLSDLAAELSTKTELTESDEWRRALLLEMRTNAILRERLRVTKRKAREQRRSLRAVIAALTSEDVASYVNKPTALSWNGDVTINAVALRVVRMIRTNCDTIPSKIYNEVNGDEAKASAKWRDVLDEIIFALEMNEAESFGEGNLLGRTAERVDRGMAYLVEYYDSLWL